MTRYEYRRLVNLSENEHEFLNEQGAEGWLLVTVYWTPGSSTEKTYYFARPLP